MSGLFSRVVVGLSVPLYQFPGTIFDTWECDFRPFSSYHPSHHLIRSSSHPFIRPVLLPVFRHGWRGVFLLAVSRPVRLGHSYRLSGCGGVSSSLPVSVLIVLWPVRFARPVVLGSVYRACFAIGGMPWPHLIVPSLLAPFSRYGGRGAVGSRACLPLWRCHPRRRGVLGLPIDRMCVRSPGLSAVVNLTDITSHQRRGGSLLAYRLRRPRCFVRSVYIIVSSAGLSRRRAAARLVLRFIVGRALLAPRRRRLAGSRFDCIIWRGRALLSCGDGKKNGGGLFCSPSPCLLGCCFLASANYSAIAPDFVVALGGLSKAGLAVLVRVELDGDSCLVLVGLLLVRFTALKEHYFNPFIGRGFVFSLPRCLITLYDRRCPPSRLFPYLWR